MDITMTDTPTDSKSDFTDFSSNESVSNPKQPTPVHIEICVKNGSRLRDKQIKKLFNDFQSKLIRFFPGKLDLPDSLSKHIKYIQICMKNKDGILVTDAEICTYIFRNNNEGIIEEIDDETSTDQVHVANTFTLPNIQFDGLFESLIFSDNLKHHLLNYMRIVSMYGTNAIDPNLISYNGLILFHGPPGTGKTSLCKALANKLSIRLINEYCHIQLIEINAHSLFSKWFSESGKLVQKLFKHVEELVEYEDSLLFVLIDEVESLSAARTSSLNGAEPSDSIRAVNALLTQIDKLRLYPNVLILTTSNISEAIDLAFIDRADLKQYIGYPNEKAVYFILRSCLNELLKKNVLFVKGNHGGYLLRYDEIKKRLELREEMRVKLEENDMDAVIPFPSRYIKKENDVGVLSPFVKMNGGDGDGGCECVNENEKCSEKLLEICGGLEGFSGRSLRKLPFITCVYYLEGGKCELGYFMRCLRKMAVFEKEQRQKLKSGKTEFGL